MEVTKLRDELDLLAREFEILEGQVAAIFGNEKDSEDNSCTINLEINYKDTDKI